MSIMPMDPRPKGFWESYKRPEPDFGVQPLHAEAGPRSGMFANNTFGPDNVQSTGSALAPGLTSGSGSESTPRRGMFANVSVPRVPMFDEGAGLQQRMAEEGAQYQADKARRAEKRGKVFGTIAAGLAGWSAGMGNPAGMAILQDMQQRRRDAAEMAWKQQAAEQESYRKMFEPREVGGNLVQRLEDGTYTTLFNAPEPFDDYAASLGYELGTPEYQEAVRNYRLGSWSEDAVEAKQGLTGYRYDRMGQLQDRRYDRMGELQGKRLDVTRRGQDLRSRDTRRGQDVRSGDTRRGQDMTDSRTRGSASYTGQGRGRGGAAPARATNPRTGQAIIFKGGRWVDERTGAPIQ